MAEGSRPLKVVIADDEPVMRSALADLIRSDTAFHVIAEAEDADGAISLAREHQPDVVVVDVKMPAGGGERAAREILSACPGTRVIALSAHDDRSSVLDMLRAGVSGYLVKGSSSGEVLEALRRSIRGQASLSSEVTADVIHELVDLLSRSERMSRHLQELDRTKRELIQVLSDELMTPITVVQGAAATMRSLGSRMAPEDAEALADSVARATQRLKRLVANLGVTSRLDREDVEVATRPTNARSIVELAVHEFPGDEDRFRVSCPQGLDVWVDQELASKALAVVLENAVEASPDGTAIDISVTDVGGEARYDVADRGPGVPDELREGIFAAFVQGSTGLTRGQRGLGIGLYLAGRILAAHAGRMEHHARPGGGSVFSLLFPAATSVEAG